MKCPDVKERQRFTREQLMVIDALINAHAEATRELAYLTKPMRDAAIACNRSHFIAAEEAHKCGHKRCEVLRVAIETAREIFLKQSNGS